MYVIANRRTGQAVTSTVDRERAERLMFGFEQLTARGDLGGRNYFWSLGRQQFGQPHPYDVGALRLLEAERDRLIAAYRQPAGNAS